MYTIASEDTFEAGQVIFQEGSSGDWVLVVLSGSVEISKMISGKKFVIGVVREGEVFGELSFLGGIKRTAAAIALEKTIVGTIDREYLDGEFNKISSEFRALLVGSVLRYAKMLERASDFAERREPRHPKTLSLTYKDRNAFIKAYTANISIGGLFIKTEKPLNKGEEFLLKLQLPGLADPVNIKSEVAWTKKEGGPAGMGVRFVEMPSEDRRILEKYIQELKT